MPRTSPAISPAAMLISFRGDTGVVFGWASVATWSVGSGPAASSSSSEMSCCDPAPLSRSCWRRSSTRV